jgi:hypothetical protein
MSKFDEEIPNCEFTGDENEKVEIRQWFECPKCHKKIWNHLYNEHVHSCSRSKRLRQNLLDARAKANPNMKIKPGLQKRRLVNSPSVGTTRSRHRKRNPIRR